MSLAYVHALDSKQPVTDAIWGLAYLGGGSNIIVSASADGSLKQHDALSGLEPANAHAFPQHTLGLVSISCSKSGHQVLSNSLEGTTTLWDVQTGQVTGNFSSYARKAVDPEADEEAVTEAPKDVDPSWSVSLHPAGENYASTGISGNVTIHSANPETFGERRRTLASGKSKFGLHCSHSPDGSRVGMASETGQIYIFDIEAGALLHTYTTHAMGVRSLSWSPDCSLLLSASEDKRIGLHDVRVAGKAGSAGGIATFSGHSSWVTSVDFSPDGRLGLSGSSDKSVKVWDIAARAAVTTVQDTGEVWAVKWKPDGSSGISFATGGDDGVVRLWRAAGNASDVT